MFPALDARAAGFNVYAVIDASGDPSEMVSRTTLARFVQSGVVPTTTNAVICELHRTWKRPEAAEIADIYTMATPNYRAVMESYREGKGSRLGQEVSAGNTNSLWGAHVPSALVEEAQSTEFEHEC